MWAKPTPDLSAARFESVGDGAAHYESFYLKLADPERPRAAWIRYTVLKRPGQLARDSLWCTLWTGEAPPRAHKVSFEPGEAAAGGDELIRIGPGRLTRQRATGSTGGAAWELEITPGSAMLPYLPSPWLYRAPAPRTKAVSLAPLAGFRGHVTVGEETVNVDGWPGMVGHNWGSEHAERWIWLHGTGFPEAPEAWLDVTIGRVKLGAVTLPWIANGGLWLDGRLHRLGGPAAIRSTHVNETRSECGFRLRGDGLSVQGRTVAPEGSVVAWRYSDPAGGEHVATNCSVASLALSVQGIDGPERVLKLSAGAAYELGGREPPQGIPIQPFPDP